MEKKAEKPIQSRIDSCDGYSACLVAICALGAEMQELKSLAAGLLVCADRVDESDVIGEIVCWGSRCPKKPATHCFAKRRLELMLSHLGFFAFCRGRHQGTQYMQQPWKEFELKGSHNRTRPRHRSEKLVGRHENLAFVETENGLGCPRPVSDHCRLEH
eukprot:Amastigsp_a869721_11.p2 type:complete len:159 gc:universal Amastigsp_a869721_11:542-66(-)